MIVKSNAKVLERDQEPGIEIFIGLRIYGPEKVVLDGTYKIPRFELME
jgi:hypothetical protein